MENLDDLSTKQLQLKLEEYVRQNEQLVNENDLFESYYKRNSESTANSPGEDKKDKQRQRQRKKIGQSVSLSTDQKIEVANAELEESQKEMEETKRSSERLIDTLRAVLEESDIRIAELKKDAYEFKRDIVVGAEHFRTGKTMAEKVIRYFEEQLRQKDGMIEKLRLKNATLKSQAHKIEGQLHQKEEMGEVLHYIDFHQLQIENKQYVAKIEERNDELLKLKMTTGNTVQILNNLKRKLNELVEESKWLKSEIKSRTETKDKIKIEAEKVKEDILNENNKKEKFQGRTEENPDMPQILDYVGQKAHMYELQKNVKDYERKIEIAEMDYKQKQRELRRAQLPTAI